MPLPLFGGVRFLTIVQGRRQPAALARRVAASPVGTPLAGRRRGARASPAHAARGGRGRTRRRRSRCLLSPGWPVAVCLCAWFQAAGVGCSQAVVCSERCHNKLHTDLPRAILNLTLIATLLQQCALRVAAAASGIHATSQIAADFGASLRPISCSNFCYVNCRLSPASGERPLPLPLQQIHPKPPHSPSRRAEPPTTRKQPWAARSNRHEPAVGLQKNGPVREAALGRSARPPG